LVEVANIGPHTEIVRAYRLRLNCFRHCLHRDADKQPLACNPPRKQCRQIVLPQVDAVRFDCQRHIEAVVHDEIRTVLARECAQFLPHAHEFARGRRLVAQLQQAHARGQNLPRRLKRGRAVQAR
jgi:hypothetical protein